MAWTPVANADIDQDSPITQPLMTAFRDNDIEGGRSIWMPYSRSQPTDSGGGQIYSYATDGAVASVATPDFEAGFDYRLFLRSIDCATDAADPILKLSLYRATTAAYGGEVSISASITGADRANGIVDILAPATSAKVFVVRYAMLSGGEPASNAWSSTANCIQVFYYLSTAEAMSRARLRFASGANFANGTIRMHRRRSLMAGAMA